MIVDMMQYYLFQDFAQLPVLIELIFVICMCSMKYCATISEDVGGYIVPMIVHKYILQLWNRISVEIFAKVT